MSYTNDDYTSDNGRSMEEVSKEIKSAHQKKFGGKKNLQAPEELPEGAGVKEEEEPSEVEDQEPPGNYHEDDPETQDDGTPEPPSPDELTSEELNQNPLELLGEEEEKEYVDQIMADAQGNYNPEDEITKKNSSLANAAKFKRFRELASPDPQAIWDGATKGATHKISACMDAMDGEVDDPGAFCGWLAKQVGYEPER